MNAIHHIVMFKLHDDVGDETRAEAVQRLTDLGKEPGVTKWLIKESLDTRKGHIIVEVAEFAGEEEYQAFRGSAAHMEVGEFMRQIADWWVGDYYE